MEKTENLLKIFFLLLVSFLMYIDGIVQFGSDPIDRQITDTLSVLQIPHPAVMSPCSGQITSWKYFTSNADPFYAQIWRHMSGFTYMLVGQYLQDPSQVGYHEMILPCKERIPIQAGDVIGFVGVVNLASIKFDATLNGGNGIALFQMPPGPLNVGSNMTFEEMPSGWQNERTYSIQVLIEPDPLPSSNRMFHLFFYLRKDRIPNVGPLDSKPASSQSRCTFFCCQRAECNAYDYNDTNNSCALFQLTSMANTVMSSGSKSLYTCFP